jgi:ATP-dependent DNA helicase RecQ
VASPTTCGDLPQRHRLLPHRRGDRGAGVVLAQPAVEAAGVLRAAPTTSSASAAEDDLAGQPCITALVATSALGMGFDKPDLGFVVHLGRRSPPSPTTSRSGAPAAASSGPRSCCCPGAEDEAIWRYFASLGFPSEEQVRQVLAVLVASPGPMSTAALEAHVDLRRTRLETMLKVLDVDGAVHRVQGGWTATGQPWAYDADRYARVSADRAAEQQAMREYAATDDCRMLFLRPQLDDPEVLDGPAGTRAGAATACTGEPCRPSSTRPPSAAAQAPLAPWACEVRAAQDVADRARPRSRAHPGRRAGL